jgi:raffinose/stachyose/melibiose transport system permease protein
MPGARRKKIRLYLAAYLLPALAIYTVFMILPILQSMRFSLFTGTGIRPNQFVGFGNYVKLFTRFPFHTRFFNVLKNNVLFFLMVSVSQNVAGFVLAVLLTRRFRGQRVFRSLFFVPTALSVIVVGFVFKLILNPVWGVFDKILRFAGLGALVRPWLGDPQLALPILSLVTAWHFVGIPIIFFTAGIDGISDDIIEAGRIDGVSAWGEVWHILLPMLRPIVGIVTILTFVGNFSEFEIVYSMETAYGNPEYATDVFGSFFYRTAFGTVMNNVNDVGLGAALASIMFVIIFAGVLSFLRITRRQA